MRKRNPPPPTKRDFATFATFQPMAHVSEYGKKKKMAEGDRNSELLKEKANMYFKGNFAGLSGWHCVSVVCNTRRTGLIRTTAM